MSYRLKDALKLHVRDAIFWSQAQQQKLQQGKRLKHLILCNSFPKSGTHLLYQILCAMPDWSPWDDIVSVQALCGMMNTANHLRWKLGAAPNRSIVRSHLMFSSEVLEILQSHSFRLFFIYRDLRDIAVSHARWVTKEPRFFLHDVYRQQSGFDEHLMSSIRGIPLGSPFSSNLCHPDIGQDFVRWQGWLSHPETLALKFEDLVGERGGGSEEKRLYLIEQVMDHLGINLSSQQIKTRFASMAMNPEESHTFVKGGKGAIGGWRTAFKPSHKEAFKAVAGQLLIDLGYEQDLSW